MRHSSTIASFLAAPLFALCLMFMGIALTGTAAAAQMEQTITLQPGWNAIHIALEPEEKEIGTIFAGLPIKSVWRWIPGRGQAQFIRDPSEGLENVDGWFGWFPEPRPEAFLTNLFTIDANISYLVRLDESAGTRQIVIRGKPRFVPTAWMADGFTLTGLPVTRDDPPTFAEFFSRSAAHEGQPIYRLTPAGQWQLVSAPAATVIRADEAYWIYTKGNSSYQGAGYGSNSCQNCGTVTRISVGGSSGKAGAVIGGIIGAVAGHEVSAQTGGSKGNQNISTVAGAAAGAVAGNAIQKNRSDGYTVHVRMDDGRTTTVTQGDVSGFREGSRVRLDNGRAYLQ